MKELHSLLNSIASIIVVDQEGSIRKAARSCGLGFRTLQRDIELLEEKLGFPVFHRTVDGVRATPEGRLLLDQAKAIEVTAAKLMSSAKALRNQSEGDVMLSTTEGLGTFWISPRLAEFSRNNPKVAIRIFPSMQLADMRRFEVDLALQVVEPLNPETKRLRVGTLHLVLAASPSYIAKYGKPTKVKDIEHHSFVFHTNPQFSDRLIIEQALGKPLNQSQFIVMRNSAAHYLTLDHGLGIGFIPSYGFGIGTKLVPIDLPIRYSMDIWLCFNSDARNIPRVALVIDWVTSLFDPRLFPWFRRDYVHPRDFDAITEANGVGDLLKGLALPV